ncbi:MAG: ABC transporter permease [Planctomycetes bacterium]|nr:ABC transporter permease [Planctomycetota bacterium]
MKTIEVKNQVRLPLGKCVELVLNGVRFRLFRSAITVVIIALAVAFLMTMLTESMVSLEVGKALKARTGPRDSLLFWSSRLTSPMNEQELTGIMAQAKAGDDRWREFQAWGALDDRGVASLAENSAAAMTYLNDFFSQITEGQRRPLVGRASGAAIFTTLGEPDRLATFRTEFAKLGKQMPTSLGEFEKFLTEWKSLSAARHKILKANADSVNMARAVLNDAQPVAFLASGKEDLPAKLARCGFVIDGRQAGIISVQARQSLDNEKIESLLKIPLVQAKLADRTKVKIASINLGTLLGEISGSSGAEWLAKLTATSEYYKAADQLKMPAFNLTDLAIPVPPAGQDQAAQEKFKKDAQAFVAANAERVRQVARGRLKDNKLAEIEASVLVSGESKGFMGFSPRTLWLIVVSFIVCVVGITNAMLMSVTERFREIATMKCLGATDGFIMVNFILESCMQGIAGGMIGSALGFILGMLRSWVSCGAMAWEQMPGAVLLAAMGCAIVTGVLLSALAAVYPAYVAARLAPMEAMRIE